ncbi:hypothetical protein J2X71_005247 [Rhizobium sp. 1399]|nr:hypothetical protein [Rhizobium sp. 1399]
MAFPDFSRGPQAGRGMNALRIHSSRHSPRQPQGQSRLSTSAASDERPGIGPLPL